MLLVVGVAWPVAPASAQTTYIADAAAGASIYGYDANHNKILTFTLGYSANTFGLAADANGTIYALHRTSVDRFSPQGVYLGSFISSNLSQATQMAFDPVGNLFITDEKLKSVQKFSSTGAFVGTFASIPNYLEGLAIDKVGNVYVSSYASSSLLRFNAAGVSLGTFGSGLLLPGNLNFDTAGNLYVCNYDNGHGGSNIKEFSALGALVHTFGTGYYDDPVGVAVGPTGNVYAGDFIRHNVLGFAPDGTSVLGYGGLDAPSAILFPAGVPEPAAWQGIMVAVGGWLAFRARRLRAAR